MFTEMKKRTYKMRRRAEGQARTRQKIVEAAADLHGTVGPGSTSISAVADKAGVQRLTVYRHFPDDESLFLACSSHWLKKNPPPDPDDWRDIQTASDRTAAALTAIYDYYRRTESMWRLVYRDIDRVPAMQQPLDAFHEYLDEVRDDLLKQWQPKGRKPRALVATIRHALTFATWASLEQQNLGARQMVDLVSRWIALAAPPGS